MGMPELPVGHLRDCATKEKINMKCLLLVLSGEVSAFDCCTLLERTALFFLKGHSWKVYCAMSGGAP